MSTRVGVTLAVLNEVAKPTLTAVLIATIPVVYLDKHWRGLITPAGRLASTTGPAGGGAIEEDRVWVSDSILTEIRRQWIQIKIIYVTERIKPQITIGGVTMGRVLH